MPGETEWIVPAIAASAQTTASAAQIGAQGKMNRATRKWNEKMYDSARQWELDSWNRVNEYNHPSNQMARLREAGINPMLVFGRGATTTASQIGSPSTPNWNPQTPDFQSLGEGLGNYLNATQHVAQIDNLRKINTLKETENLKAIQQIQEIMAKTGKAIAETDMQKLLMKLKPEMQNTYLEVMRANMDRIRQDTESSRDANARANALQEPNLKNAWLKYALGLLEKDKVKAETGLINAKTTSEHGVPNLQYMQRQKMGAEIPALRARVYEIAASTELKKTQEWLQRNQIPLLSNQGFQILKDLKNNLKTGKGLKGGPVNSPSGWSPRMKQMGKRFYTR